MYIYSLKENKKKRQKEKKIYKKKKEPGKENKRKKRSAVSWILQKQDNHGERLTARIRACGYYISAVTIQRTTDACRYLDIDVEINPTNFEI
ncbi:hypothetical protein V1478_013637 [Vespula squamosa]|uniref:Uncharacterized protein n=1 Tax=Vespula squamosa TaxID=30214 RepID=A0ABD2A5T9_VESSQ